MLRRRDLLRQGIASNLDTWLQFPLYFDFDSDVSDSFWGLYLTRTPDDTSRELSSFLTNYLIENCFVKGDQNGNFYELNNPSDVGIEIYFKNLKVININYFTGDSVLVLKLNGTYKAEGGIGVTNYDFVYLKRIDGEIFIED